VRSVLFDARAHEPLLDAPWSPAAIEAEIRTIAREADDALHGGDWWPVHPLDDDGPTPDAIHGIYFGAAGVVWALDHLARAGLHEPRHDYARLALDVLDSYLARPEFDGPLPSLWMGEGGIALVAWLLAPAPALADRLAKAVVVDPDGDTLELMWGSPGQLLIADAMLERTGEQRWAAAWSAIADHLMRQWGAHVPGVWTQRLYGSVREILGPAHGFAGIVAALARRPERLDHGRLVPGTTAALSASAVREGGQANWPPRYGGPLDDAKGVVRTQWCHGAPGIVASIAALPRDDELDALLLAGGELTWAAGPLRKGANLCHGTAGNGFALLKLFARTGDEAWLERARRFAMHAARQVAADRRQYGRGRFSLWTGDVGTAVYLQRCLAGTSEVPGIDAW
jgi:Lanthionine synthetase C-like protein